ncbi:MAG: hypothetical protein Q9159_006763 [Coniocarpon cinnabarinum]
MTPKRKADHSDSSAPPSKKSATEEPPQFDHSRVAEKYGIVQREFYPPEISNERCAQYSNGEIPRPIELLEKCIKDTASKRDAIQPGKAVIHWFKRDLRLKDNKPLSQASQLAKSKGIPLICFFVVSPQDYQAHLTSRPRVDFELRSLAVMKEDLAELDIPLVVETVEKRKHIPNHIIARAQEWGANHIFGGIEYEVDELRRDKLIMQRCLEHGIAFNTFHDDVVVTPGSLRTGSGRQFSVYSPWYRAWVKYIHEHSSVLDGFETPASNPSSARKDFKSLFDISIPSAPPNKSLSEEERNRFASIWPAGEHEAHERLHKFLREKIQKYKDTRNFPSANSTALLSPHFSAGTLAARTAVRLARDANSTKKLDGGDSGISGWISEIAWRDFYVHVLAHWPYVCMNKSFKYEYSDIEWEYDLDLFDKWCKGSTGYPIVDAGMRQANYMGYMHNRCRMIVASFLSKDLLIDWRMGERWFMEHLIDGSFASNNGGWGFSASTGVDPQPYFRIFNPLLQSEKFDESGDYIRRWVPELADVAGKAVHDVSTPYLKIIAVEGFRANLVKFSHILEEPARRLKRMAILGHAGSKTGHSLTEPCDVALLNVNQ